MAFLYLGSISNRLANRLLDAAVSLATSAASSDATQPSMACGNDDPTSVIMPFSEAIGQLVRSCSAIVALNVKPGLVLALVTITIWFAISNAIDCVNDQRFCKHRPAAGDKAALAAAIVEAVPVIGVAAQAQAAGVLAEHADVGAAAVGAADVAAAAAAVGAAGAANAAAAAGAAAAIGAATAVGAAAVATVGAAAAAAAAVILSPVRPIANWSARDRELRRRAMEELYSRGDSEYYGSVKELERSAFPAWQNALNRYGAAHEKTVAAQERVVELLRTCDATATKRRDAFWVTMFRTCIRNMEASADKPEAASCQDIYDLATRTM